MYEFKEYSADLKLMVLAHIPMGISGGLFYSVWGLYFKAEGLSASYLGFYTFLEGILTAVMLIPAGIIADRIGRKNPTLLGYFISALSLIVVLFGLNTVTIFLSALLGGIGFLSIPTSQAWFADLAGEKIEEASSLSTFLYNISYSLGSLMGWIPEILVNFYYMSYSEAYRFSIFLSLIFTLVAVPIVSIIEDDYVPPPRSSRNLKVIETLKIPIVLRLVGLIGMFNFALSLFYPLSGYYFGVKFNVESGPVGTLHMVIHLISSFSYLAAPMISRNIGFVKFVILSQGGSILPLLLVPFTSNFLMASALLIIQTMGAYMATPLIWAFYNRNTPIEDRGVANSLYTLAARGSGAISSFLGGELMDIMIDLPIFALAMANLAYIILFAFVIGRFIHDNRKDLKYSAETISK